MLIEISFCWKATSKYDYTKLSRGAQKLVIIGEKLCEKFESYILSCGVSNKNKSRKVDVKFKTIKSLKNYKISKVKHFKVLIRH